MSAKPTVVPRSTLYEKTILLLRNRPRTMTLRKISEETGLPHAWLCSLTKSHKPSVDRIEHLYNYLNKKPLNL